MRALLAVARLLTAMAASGQVYRWTDLTGKVHYGDRPPGLTNTDESYVVVDAFDVRAEGSASSFIPALARPS